MSDADLVIRGATVVGRDELSAGADVAVIDGAIAEVGPELATTGRDEVDARGLHLFPGGIDSHVHFDEPGRADWEGLASGTAALAAGGMTAFVDMPLNNLPVTIDGASFDAKLAAAERSSLVDFGFWGGLVPGNVDRLEELAERGVVGVKAFTCHSGIDEFPRADDLTLYEGMARCAELGLIVSVHAENAEIVAGLAQRAREGGRTGARDFVASRPAIAEIEAIARTILFAEEAGCALHVVHVSTARGVALVAEAQARGVDVTCETCPHFLLFTEDDVDELGILLKSAPPVRDAAVRDALWAALADGTLPMVVSDHSPGPPELKQGDDFFAMWGGIAGCQSTLPLLLEHGHAQRGLSLPLLAAVTSANIAERFGLARKGAVEVGHDADFALVDLSHTATLQADDLRYRYRTSCYVGSAVRGRVVRTLVRGRTVFADGRVVGEPAGRLLTPTTTTTR